MDKADPSVAVAGYIKVVPKDREAHVKALQAHVPRVAILGWQAGSHYVGSRFCISNSGVAMPTCWMSDL
jgi:hypothetical protein